MKIIFKEKPVIWYNHSPDDNAAMDISVFIKSINACKMLCQIRTRTVGLSSPYIMGQKYKPVTLLDFLF